MNLSISNFKSACFSFAALLSVSTAQEAVPGESTAALLSTVLASLARAPDHGEEPGMIKGYELQCELRTKGDHPRTAELVKALLSDAAPRAGKAQWGWGVNKPSDAFGDGSLTPAGTPYAITSAVAIHALLDYATQASADPKLVAEIGRVIGNVIEHWIDFGFEPGTARRGGFFHYSMADHDANFTVNCSMALASAMARSLSLPAVSSAVNASRWRACVKSSIALAIAQLTPDVNGEPSWFYHDTEVSGKPWVNYRQDLVHHVYTLHSFEILRDLGYAVPWTTAASLRSLGQYWRKGGLMSFPSDARFPPQDENLIDRPARLWATGLYLRLVSIYGTDHQAQQALRALDAYNLETNPRSWAPGFQPEALATALDLAHCSIGLAEFIQRQDKARSPR